MQTRPVWVPCCLVGLALVSLVPLSYIEQNFGRGVLSGQGTAGRATAVDDVDHVVARHIIISSLPQDSSSLPDRGSVDPGWAAGIGR